jgi:cysteine rich repeat protein
LKRRLLRQQRGFIQMINMLRCAPALWASMTAILVAAVTPAFSQAPTDAQRSAIRSQCRSDYQANCAGVPPGGMASLQCLQKNMSSLSSGCQAAVRAVEAPAEPKAESAPAAAPKESAKESAAPAKPAAETAAPAVPKDTAGETAKETVKETPKAAAGTAAKKPSSTQIAAIRSACRSDYQKVCAGVPTGGAPALQCLEKNKSKVSAACQQAVNAASGGGTPAAASAPSDAATTSPGASPAAAPATALVLRPMRPREELFVLRSACGGDVRALCGGVPPGGGRIMQCLAAQAASLSPACTDVLGQFAAQ